MIAPRVFDPPVLWFHSHQASAEPWCPIRFAQFLLYIDSSVRDANEQVRLE